MNKKQQYSIITIENFPSRAELIYILNSFLTQNNYPKNYKWENRETIVDIIFADPAIALEFLGRMDKEKARNNLYAKTHITMTMKSKEHGFPSNKSSDAKNISFSGLLLDSLTKLTRKKRELKRTALYSQPSRAGIEHSYSHYHLLDLTRKAGIIANDSPYMSPMEKMAKEARDNRKKWISKQNFCAFVGKSASQKNMLKNYVRITPSIPVSNYMFRGIYKDKWLDKKDFQPW